MIRHLLMGVLFEQAGDITGGGGGSSANPSPIDPSKPAEGAVPPTPATPPTSETPKEEPFAVFHKKEQFEERLQRATRSELKSLFGTDNVDEIKAQWEKAKELEEAEEQRRREAMSEQERLKADADAAKARADAAEAERDRIAFESHVNGICARLGIKNVDYAMFAVAGAAEQLGESDELDAEKLLQEMLDADESRAALGIAPKPTVEGVPVTTTPNPGQEQPTPQPNPSEGKSVMDMSREEFARHLAGKGVGLTS